MMEWWRQFLDSKFKKGDSIVFLVDISAGYERDHKLLIPAFKPCTVLNINSAHITVRDSDGTIQKLRYIPKRMAPAGDLAKAIYGKI